MTTEFIEHLGISVTGTMTTPTKASKKPRPVWEVYGRTAGLEDILYGMGAKKWKGKFSFWEDPTEDLKKLDADNRLSVEAQQERKDELAEKRASRYLERANNHKKISDGAYERSNQIAERFAGGQPILVGHHSEKGARRDKEKIHAAMSKSIQEGEYASHLADKAHATIAHSQRKHNKEFIGNRIEDCQKGLRDTDRRLAKLTPDQRLKNLEEKQAYLKFCQEDKWGVDDVQKAIDYLSDPTCYDAAIARLKHDREEFEEKLAYWQKQMEELGGVAYSNKTVKKDDWVLVSTGWYRVYRSNAKTATLHYFSHEQTWANPVKWHEIRNHKAAEEVEQLVAEGKASHSQGLHKVQLIAQ
jgi:hypothetical protein